jgi:hypothetical protein
MPNRGCNQAACLKCKLVMIVISFEHLSLGLEFHFEDSQMHGDDGGHSCGPVCNATIITGDDLNWWVSLLLRWHHGRVVVQGRSGLLGWKMMSEQCLLFRKLIYKHYLVTLSQAKKIQQKEKYIKTSKDPCNDSKWRFSRPHGSSANLWWSSQVFEHLSLGLVLQYEEIGSLSRPHEVVCNVIADYWDDLNWWVRPPFTIAR